MRTESSERLTSWAMAGLVVLAMVGFDPWGWAPFGPLKWALITTGALLLVAAVVAGGGFTVHRSSALVWIAFLAWAAVTSALALDPLSAWIGTPDRRLGWLAWLLFALVFVAGQSVRTRAGLVSLLRGAVVALLGIGVYVSLELVDLAPVDLAASTERAGGPFGTAAYLGAACALLVPIVAGAAADGLDGMRWRVAAWVATGLGAVATVAAQTRAAWVGLAVAAIVVAAVFWSWIRTHLRAVAAAVIVLIAVVIVTPTADRLVAALDFGDGTARGRIDEWQVGGRVLASQPVVGVGFEGYRIAFPQEVDADYERRYTRLTTPDRAHNGLLDVGATTGLLGLAAYLVAAVWFIRLAVRAIRTRRPAAAGLGAGVLAFVLQQQFLFPTVEVDIVFWVVAGAMVASLAPGARVEIGWRRGWAAVPAVLAVAALVLGGLDVAADRQARTASEEGAVGRHAAALDAADRAAALRPDSFRYHFIAAGAAAAVGTPDGLAAAIVRLEDALRLSPSDPILLAEQASIRLDLARTTTDSVMLGVATAEWEQLVVNDPNNARYHLELGLAYASGGSVVGAEREWLIAADLAPRSAAPWTNLAGLYAQLQRSDEAAAALESARAIDPAFPPLVDLERRLAGSSTADDN